MRRDLLARLFVDATTEDGTIDADDFYQGVAVGTGEEEHRGGEWFYWVFLFQVR